VLRFASDSVRLREKAAEHGLSVSGCAAGVGERWRKGCAVNDQLDVTVHDSEVLAEIEMMTRLIIATSESDVPLSQARIDELLGVRSAIPRARQP
jgi:hypothetical protein